MTMRDRARWTWWTATSALGLVVLFAAGGAWGQSLAEAAKREKERRAKSGPTGPAFGDEDLMHRGDAAVSTSGEARDSAGGPVGEGAVGDKPSDTNTNMPTARRGAGDEAYWRGRAKARRDAVTAAEARVTAAEAAADNTSSGIRQPLPGDAMKQVPRSTVTDGAKRAAEANLEAAKAELARAQKALEDLEDEARRKGVLPGWLR
jgi:hypothetical protein